MQSATAPLFIEDIRDFVVNTARNNPPSPEHGWDTCYGAGRVDAVESVRAQRSASQIPDAIVDSQPLAAAASVVPVAGNGDVGTTPDVKGVASAAAVAALATPSAGVANTSLAVTTPGADSTEIGIGKDSDAKFTSLPPAEGS
jgi:hypothetical protein